jgi:phosphate transport system protein
MSVHFQREVERLKQQFLRLGAEVEGSVHDAVAAVESRDPRPAQAVIDREAETNAREVDIEEECLKILALHQPVAGDLRYVIAILKINQDLERIGDLAMHIAERALVLCRHAPLPAAAGLGEMGAKAQWMLKRSLDALVQVREDLAREVCAADDQVDAMNRAVLQRVQEGIRACPDAVLAHLQVMHIARHLERIADHATNIAEDLIYQIEGEIVRHKPVAPPAG